MVGIGYYHNYGGDMTKPPETRTHSVKLEVLITMEEMESTPEVSAEIAMNITDEILAEHATHWNAQVTVMEAWDTDEQEVTRKVIE